MTKKGRKSGECIGDIFMSLTSIIPSWRRPDDINPFAFMLECDCGWPIALCFGVNVLGACDWYVQLMC